MNEQEELIKMYKTLKEIRTTLNKIILEKGSSLQLELVDHRVVMASDTLKKYINSQYGLEEE